MSQAIVREKSLPRSNERHSLHDKALADELKRLKEAEQADRDVEEELARLRELARFD